MYRYLELEKFLESSSDEGIDFEKVLVDLEHLIYYTSKSRGKRLTVDQVDDAKAQFIADLLSMPRPIINGIGYCLSHAIRIVYWVTGSDFNLLPLDDSISLMPIVNPTVDIYSDFDHNFLEIFNSYLIHKDLKDYLLSLKFLDVDFMLYLIKSDTSLGVLLTTAYLRHKFMLPMSRVINLNNLNSREEEILFGMVLVRINQDWTISQYILMREIFLISLVTFLDPFITDGNSIKQRSSKSAIFKNLLFCVKVFCYYEKLCPDLGVEGAVKACGQHFGICNRHVSQKINRIEGRLLDYDRIIEHRIKLFKSDVNQCTREYSRSDQHII